MKVLDCLQGSPEWHEARLGVLTASHASELITPAKLARSKQADALLYRLITERYTGQSAEEFAGNKWTERGHDLEPMARDAFSFQTGLNAAPVGFVYRDASERTGCSPDWLNLGERWGAEVKCPAPHRHVRYLLEGTVPADYVPQVQFSLWCLAGHVDAWWFLSYAPELPLLAVRVEPEPRWQEAFDEHVPAFLGEVEKAYARLEELANGH